MDFLNVKDKIFLITGVANKKSVAYFTAKSLKEYGANIILTVQNENNLEKTKKLFPDTSIVICDVEQKEHLVDLNKYLVNENIKIDGFLHSIAFANYSEGIKPFHETNIEDFFQASHISCLSLLTITNAIKNQFQRNASIVTISISSTRATSYGYMGPIKAALDSSVAFLAKSLSEFSNIRVNAVCSGPLKTSASAGIPGYINNYIFAEKLTLRKKALNTQEVANTACFLLSPSSSGINATGVVIDAGMSCNYFDQEVVDTVANN